MHCPICGSKKFIDRSNRQNAQCLSCRAMERTRLLYIVLKKLGLLNSGMKILHLEPENSLKHIFSSLSPLNYYAFSRNSQKVYDKSKFESNKIQTYYLDCFEYCKGFPRQSFDLIIHNHFLETIPYSLEYFLNLFTDLLKPSGNHLFTVCIGKGLSKESFDLPEHERLRQYGNSKRVRSIGREDFVPMLRDLWRTKQVYIQNRDLMSLDEYMEAALPHHLFDVLNASTIFHQKKI